MAKYIKLTNYVKDLGNLYRKTRDALVKLQNKLQGTEEERKTLEKGKRERNITEADYIMGDAQLKILEATNRKALDKLLEEYKAEAAAIRSDLEEALEDKYTATPDKLDQSTMQLLDSGITTVDELAKLAEGANPIMRRVIAKHAKTMADEAATYQIDIKRAATTLATTLMQHTDGKAELEAFDALTEWANRALTVGAIVGGRLVGQGDFGYAEAFAASYDDAEDNTLAAIEALEDRSLKTSCPWMFEQ